MIPPWDEAHALPVQPAPANPAHPAPPPDKNSGNENIINPF